MWCAYSHNLLSCSHILSDFADTLTGILEAGSSVNMYMFHGGTNFGFMSGANRFSGSTYKPDVTSYGMKLKQ